MSDPDAQKRPAGTVDIDGDLYMKGSKGEWVPYEAIKPQDLLEDETVRTIFAKAEELAALLKAFKVQTFEDLAAFNALLAERYGAKAGGEKGNMTLSTYDGLLKVSLHVSDRIKFGPGLQQAQVLIEACGRRWTTGARAEVRTIIGRAFRTDKEGQISVTAVLSLLQYDFTDPEWLQAMEALKDAIRPDGSREYVRFFRRATYKSDWEPVSLNLAHL